MLNPYLQLSIVSLLPVCLSVLFYLWSKTSSFQKISPALQQLIIGVVFGLVAVAGNEYGIQMNGVIVNCRDGAVLCAGLLFGGPAGILAGLIGGIERWLCVYWGGGSFTRLACSVSTILAGVYAALLRKYMFDDKKPGWGLAGVIGVVMEVFHLTMVFLTNLSQAEQAAQVVKACTWPMVLSNSLAVLLATVAVSLCSRESLGGRNAQPGISQTIQRWLLVCVVSTFALTSALVWSLQDNLASSQTESLLQIALDDVQDAILDASDQNLLALTRRIATQVPYGNLTFIARSSHVAEINVIDENGIITASTYSAFVGYDMASGEQSAFFLPLLDGSEAEMVQPYGKISYDDSMSRKYAAVALEDGGFVQVGYDPGQFQEDLSGSLLDTTRYRHVGQNGFLFVSNAVGEIVSGQDNVSASNVAELPLLRTLLASEPTEGKVYELYLGEKDVYLMFRETEGYRIFSVVPVDDALQNRNVVVFVNAYMEILTFAVQFALIYLLIKKVVVNNIRSVNDSLSKITNGNLDVTVNVRDNAEFASLSDDINSTVDTMKKYIAEAAARIDAELEFARSIQTSSLPTEFPPFPNRPEFDIYALMDTAKEVGGDFYDFYLLGEDKLCFVVADVSGKGIPASLFMMRAKTELKRLAETGADLDAIFAKANDDLCNGNEAGMFVTAWMGILDLDTGVVEFVNAGHNPPLINYADSGFEYLRGRAGLVLGGMSEMRYRRLSVQMNPGDTLFLYTDGVTEATDAGTELFGEDRLRDSLDEAGKDTMQSLCEAVKKDVDEFVAEAPQFDDITMVALRYLGRNYPTMHFEHAAISDITAVTEFVETELEKLDCPMSISMKLSVAIDEIFSNIVFYAYEGGTGPATVQLRPQTEPRAVTLVFEDEGMPYNPLSKPDPDITLSAEERMEGGLGILIVKKFMDDVSYEYKKGKNTLSLYKKF